MQSSLKDNFCSSPWFHIRIDSQGNYLPCRWSSQRTSSYNIANTTIGEYMNSPTMNEFRLGMLNGVRSTICEPCYYEDSKNKVSGRQRQLLKSAISLENFTKSFATSPHWSRFAHSANHQGQAQRLPTDLQIDLGNVCNSACVMCSPIYSSRLAGDYVKLNNINKVLFQKYPSSANWTDDNQLVDKFVNEIADIDNLRYIHFLGGETLYLKSFYDICDRLIGLGVAKNIIIGTTTNGTVYTDQLERIIREFKHVHLGISVEAFHPVNDYIRYPSSIDQVTANVRKFLELRNQTQLHVELRITPSILSVSKLSTLFGFMLENRLTAESCNILYEPGCLRIELLPDDLRQEIIKEIDQLINDYGLTESADIVINRRREDLTESVISSIIFEYRNFLATLVTPSDADHQRQNLVKFLQAFESIRNNSILTYLPNYEKFLRSYGY